MGVFKDIQLRSCIDDLSVIKNMLEKTIKRLEDLPSQYTEVNELDKNTRQNASRISGNKSKREMQEFFEGISKELNDKAVQLRENLTKDIELMHKDLQKLQLPSIIRDFCRNRQRSL